MEKRTVSMTVTKIIHIYTTMKSTCVIVNKMQAKYTRVNKNPSA